MLKQDLARQLEDETVRRFLEGKLTLVEIGKALGVSEDYVRAVAKRRGLKRKPGLGSPAWRFRNGGQA